MRLSGVGIWSTELHYGDPGNIAEAATELEVLGYTALWIPDIGGDIFTGVDRLLGATGTAVVATGVLNLWMHSAADTADAYMRLTAQHGDRLLVGIGVGHQPFMDSQQPGVYRKPISAVASYLDDLDTAAQPLPQRSRVLAALGPKMLGLARERTAGVHSYNVTPEHTALAREMLGPDRLLLPEQAVVVTTDSDAARSCARRNLIHSLQLPNYINNLVRIGFSDDDFIDGGSDRLVDALFAWGSEEEIAARIKAHRDAGADHVCVKVLRDAPELPRADWRLLAPALTCL